MPEPWRPVPTPCIKVCTLDPAGGLCMGCHRTLREIAAWGTMSDAERNTIMASLPQRAASGKS